MVSNASEDLPEPLRPVSTISCSRGISTSTFFRLFSLAPLMPMVSLISPLPYPYEPPTTLQLTTMLSSRNPDRAGASPHRSSRPPRRRDLALVRQPERGRHLL